MLFRRAARVFSQKEVGLGRRGTRRLRQAAKKAARRLARRKQVDLFGNERVD